MALGDPSGQRGQALGALGVWLWEPWGCGSGSLGGGALGALGVWLWEPWGCGSGSLGGGAMLRKALVLASDFFLASKNLFLGIKFITIKQLIYLRRKK